MADQPAAHRTVPRADSDRLIALARAIVRGDSVFVDDNPAWRTSLLLMASELPKYTNLGAIAVPLGPHMRGMWINGCVPAVVLEVNLVAHEDMPALRSRIKDMQAALYPEE